MLNKRHQRAQFTSCRQRIFVKQALLALRKGQHCQDYRYKEMDSPRCEMFAGSFYDSSEVPNEPFEERRALYHTHGQHSVGVMVWYTRGTAQHTREMLLRILLASLGRLADLGADGLPLVVLVLLDGVHEGGALLFVLISICYLPNHVTSIGVKKVGANYLILSKLGVMHVLVPMLLDGAFGTGRKSLFLSHC